MHQSYRLGVDDVLDWLKQNEHLSDNISYLIEEFVNQTNQK
jgi:ribosomal protein S16